jgi:D-cysteine desulfhydrase
VAQRLWIKRDDRTSALYGGNKVRKLEFILAALLRSGCRQLVSFGATGTNHGVAVAAFCQQQGVACTLLLFDQPATANVARNLRLMQHFGAELIYCGSLWNTVLNFYLLQRWRYRGACFLFAGGSNVEGCIGFVNAAFELGSQIERGLLPEPRVIYCALGSGAMLAGLTLGCALAGVSSEVRGVRVAASHLGIVPSCTQATVTRLMRQTYSQLRRLDPAIPKMALPEVKLEHRYFGSGYGVPTEAGEKARRRLADAGIELELTYTAKAAAAALEHCERHPDDTVLYWHSYNSVDMTARIASADVSMLEPPLRELLRQIAASPEKN